MCRSTLATTDPLRGEIDASRARLVDAADEARRRLERDLHDGAQQRFVLATVWLRRAAARARGTAAEPLVDEAFQQLQQGLAELRDLARGIHPTVLSERGLAAALTGLAARSCPCAPAPRPKRASDQAHRRRPLPREAGARRLIGLSRVHRPVALKAIAAVLSHAHCGAGP